MFEIKCPELGVGIARNLQCEFSPASIRHAQATEGSLVERVADLERRQAQERPPTLQWQRLAAGGAHEV